MPTIHRQSAGYAPRTVRIYLALWHNGPYHGLALIFFFKRQRHANHGRASATKASAGAGNSVQPLWADLEADLARLKPQNGRFPDLAGTLVADAQIPASNIRRLFPLLLVATAPRKEGERTAEGFLGPVAPRCEGISLSWQSFDFFEGPGRSRSGAPKRRRYPGPPWVASPCPGGGHAVTTTRTVRGDAIGGFVRGPVQQPAKPTASLAGAQLGVTPDVRPAGFGPVWALSPM